MIKCHRIFSAKHYYVYRQTQLFTEKVFDQRHANNLPTLYFAICRNWIQQLTLLPYHTVVQPHHVQLSDKSPIRITGKSDPISTHHLFGAIPSAKTEHSKAITISRHIRPEARILMRVLHTTPLVIQPTLFKIRLFQRQNNFQVI